MSSKRQILLCVAGGTPQIITETLWALMQPPHNVIVDEIRVITTRDGAEKILTGKINGRGAPDESLLVKDYGQFLKYQKDYPSAAKIKFDANCLYLLTTKRSGIPSPRDDESEQLKDIVTDEDNERAANQICEIVQDLAADENVVIHASIAGGRKTMSLYLMAAMQLFGRNHDRISHVLVSKDAEVGAPKFFYKPPQPEPVLDFKGQAKTKTDGSALTTDDIEINLADIPFIRLSGVGSSMLKETGLSYEAIVKAAQTNLERFNLTLMLREGKIKVGQREVDQITPVDFFVYVMFAHLRKQGRGKEGFAQADEISLADFDAVRRLISNAYGSECGYKDFITLREDALEKLNYQFYRERHPHDDETKALSAVKKALSQAASATRRDCETAKSVRTMPSLT